MQKSGVFKRDDLNMYIDFMLEECELSGPGKLSYDKITQMLKEAGIADRINEESLKKFMNLYFNYMMKSYQKGAGVEY